MWVVDSHGKKQSEKRGRGVEGDLLWPNVLMLNLRGERERERRESVVVGGHINSSNRLHQANSAGCEKFATI